MISKSDDHYKKIFLKNQSFGEKEFITEGGFGYIYKSYLKRSKQEVAVKILSLRNKDQRLARSWFKNELNILKLLNHPNIIQVVYSNQNSFHFALPFANGGSLATFVQELTWSNQQVELTLHHIFRQLTGAVRYLHKNGVIHNDIKTDNVLVMTKESLPDVKLTDFDNSYYINTPIEKNCFPGTLQHAPPEQLKNYKLRESFLNNNSINMDIEYEQSTTAVDIYNIGLCLYESMKRDYWCDMEESIDCCLSKMEGDNFVEDLRSCLDNEVAFSENMYCFLNFCLKFNKDDRATADELCSHVWLLNDVPSTLIEIMYEC